MGRKDYYYSSNMPQINSIVAAASAVVTMPDGKLVLHKRKDNDQWSLLGGAMEYGETIEQTILREVKEESGLDCAVTRIIGVYTNPNHIIAYSNGEVRQEFSICFHCVAHSGTITVSDESKEVCMFSREELALLNLHPAQRIRIDDYFREESAALIR